MFLLAITHLNPLSLTNNMSNLVEKRLLDGSVINFFHRKQEYRSLSNFWQGNVCILGEDGETRSYESGEHAFHGEKYKRLANECDEEDDILRKTNLNDYSLTFLVPSIYTNGETAKKMGGKKGFPLSKEELELWSVLSILVQIDICKWKVSNYNQVRDDLNKSRGKFLVHPAMRCSEEKLVSGGHYWEGKGIIKDGKVEVIGHNGLGNIWMEFRDIDINVV